MSDDTQLRARIEERLRTLGVRLARIEGHLRQPGNRDWQERATELENDEVLEHLSEAEHLEVDALRAALARLDAGRYGNCIGCGESIDPSRLEAIPTATHCIACAA